MKLYHGNPRRITKKRYMELEKSLDDLGDISGIVHDLNSDQVIGGNQRSTVFDVAKMTPVIVEQFSEPTKQGTMAWGYIEWHGERFTYRVVRWTPEQCERANIKANIAAGTWDWDILAGWKTDKLQTWGMDAETLATWNNDAANLATMLQAEEPAGDADAEPQIDRAAELNEKWQVKTGDLWRIGEHRLLCGDSTKRDDVERVMQGEKADMVWTDPPYGVDYEGGAGNESKREKLEGDDSGDLYLPALKMYKSFCNAGAPMYIWFASSVGKPVFEAVSAIGYDVRAMIIWNKIDAHYGAFMAQYMQKHEPCLYIVNGNPKWIGPTNDITVWDVKQPSVNEFHPTEKPLELAMHPIKNHDAPIVADFFAGSGPALVASQNLKRKCRAIEKKPAFCAVILERMITAFPDIVIERIEA